MTDRGQRTIHICSGPQECFWRLFAVTLRFYLFQHRAQNRQVGLYQHNSSSSTLLLCNCHPTSPIKRNFGCNNLPTRFTVSLMQVGSDQKCLVYPSSYTLQEHIRSRFAGLDQIGLRLPPATPCKFRPDHLLAGRFSTFPSPTAPLPPGHGYHAQHS